MKTIVSYFETKVENKRSSYAGPLRSLKIIRTHEYYDKSTPDKSRLKHEILYLLTYILVCNTLNGKPNIEICRRISYACVH